MIEGFYSGPKLEGKQTELTERDKEFMPWVKYFYEQKDMFTADNIEAPPGERFNMLLRWALGSSRYQYPVINLAAVLAYMAGMQGQRYYVEGGGLNIFATVQAGSGVGKNSLHDLNASIPNALKDVEAEDLWRRIKAPFFTGESALGDLIEQRHNNTILCVVPEQSKMLKALQQDSHGLSQVIRDCFSNSGNGKVLAFLQKSGKESRAFRDCAISIVGDLTGADFHDLFDEKDVESGMWPRNLFFPPPSEALYSYTEEPAPMPEPLRQALIEQLNRCNVGPEMRDGERIRVEFAEDARAYNNAHIRLFEEFIKEFKGSSSIKEVLRRTAQKTERVAANVAAFENPHNPVIDRDIYHWARKVVWMCDFFVVDVLKTGNFGTGATRQEAEVCRILKELVIASTDERRKLFKDTVKATDLEMKANSNLVTWSILYDRLCKVGAFKKDANGNILSASQRKSVIEAAVASCKTKEFIRVADENEVTIFGFRLKTTCYTLGPLFPHE